MTWTIRNEATGEEATLAALGIAELTRNLADQSTDTVDVTFRNGIRVGEGWARGGIFTVRVDGAQWFYGRRENPSRSLDAQAQTRSVQFVGPWWYLESLDYRQPFLFVTDDPLTVTSTETLTTEAALSPVVVLSEDAAGTRINTADGITQVLNYAIESGAKFQLGDMATGIDVPRQEMRDQTCASVIQAYLRWTPDVTPYFDYATTPPTLHFIRRADKAVLEYEIGNSSADVVIPAGLTLAARYDAVLPGVEITYMLRHTRGDSWFFTRVVDSAGELSKWRALHRTFELEGTTARVETDGDGVESTTIAAGESIPVGVAARVLDAFGELHHEGTVPLKSQDLPLENWLASVLNLTGGPQLWETMRADIRSVRETPQTGEVSLTLGLPVGLGPADLVELLRDTRSRVAVPLQSPRNGVVHVPAPPANAPTPQFQTGTPPAGDYDELPLSGFMVSSDAMVGEGSVGVGQGNDHFLPAPATLPALPSANPAPQASPGPLESYTTQTNALSAEGVAPAPIGYQDHDAYNYIMYRRWVLNFSSYNPGSGPVSLANTTRRIVLTGTKTIRTQTVPTAVDTSEDIWMDVSAGTGLSQVSVNCPFAYGPSHSPGSYVSGSYTNRCTITFSNVRIYEAANSEIPEIPGTELT